MSRHVVLDTRVVRGAGGGPDKTILNSPRFLADSGYRMLCAYMHPPHDPGFEQLRRRAEQLGAPLLAIPDRGAWDWRVLRHLLDICRREKVAIWHGHDYKSNLLGLLLRPSWPMRLVTTVHGWGVRSDRRTQLYYGIDRLCLRHYDLVFPVSGDLHARCLSLGVPADRCVLLENGVDTWQFARRCNPREAKARLGIPPHRLVIGAVGRLSAEKEFDLLIRCAGALLDRGLDLELWIVGEGEQGPRLRRLAEESGHGGRIRLPGYRAETMDYYEAMDVYALSSSREGLPNVVLEAMAMGVPVVATRIAGIPGLVRHEENGLLVAPGSAAGLTEALARLLADAGLRERLRREGRRTVEASYSFAARMERLRAAYDRLQGRLGRKHEPAPAATPLA